jgi:hypothetical protein
LPPIRIQRAYELGEVDLQEDPATSCLGPRNYSALGTATDLFGMHMEEGGSLV